MPKYLKGYDRSTDRWTITKKTDEGTEWIADAITETVADGILALLRQDETALMQIIKPPPELARVVKVWTMSYNPMAFGDLHRPIATELLLNPPVDIGRGYRAYIVRSPSGKTFIADAISGAFVGTDLEQVRKDVATGDPALMKMQVEEASKECSQAQLVSNQAFWEQFAEERKFLKQNKTADKPPNKPKKRKSRAVPSKHKR